VALAVRRRGDPTGHERRSVVLGIRRRLVDAIGVEDDVAVWSVVPKAPIKIGKEKRMKDPYDEGVANRIGPESCVGDREVAAKR
jgi:hypothetical protein